LPISPPACRQHCAHSRGVTLVELLAALSVVAVAIIGIAALYGSENDPEQPQSSRLQAAQLAEQIAARIEQDAAGRSGYASVVGVLCNAPLRSKRADDAAARAAACWHNKVEKELPNGTGAVTRDASTVPPTYVVAVSWSTAETGTASYVMRVQPKN
jgi:type IV pilus assembly protein PilV